MSRTRVGLRFGPTAPQRWTVWLNWSSRRALGMSRGPAITKGRVITPSFSRILTEIAWKSAIESKGPDECAGEGRIRLGALSDEPAEDEPGDVADQDRQNRKRDEHRFASDGHDLSASGLDVLGAVLYMFISCCLSLHDGELLSLQRQRIRLAVELYLLIVSDFFQYGDEQPGFFVIHGFPYRLQV